MRQEGTVREVGLRRNMVVLAGVKPVSGDPPQNDLTSSEEAVNAAGGREPGGFLVEQPEG